LGEWRVLAITNFTGHPSLTLRAGFVQVFHGRSDLAPDPSGRLPTFSPSRRELSEVDWLNDLKRIVERKD
jgi:hypothetical protein